MDDIIIHTEKKILSALMHDSKVLEKTFSIVDENDFSQKEFRILYKMMFDMYNEGKIPTDTAISNRLLVTNQLNKVPLDLIGDISDTYITSAHIEQDIDQVISFSKRRQLSTFGNLLLKSNSDGNTEIADTIAFAEKELLNITRDRRTGDFKNVGDVAIQVVNTLHNIKSSGQTITGTAIGYKDLDKMTAGFQPGDLVVIAARPGMGKTALALNMLMNASKEINHEDECVVFFSLEMPEHQLVTRILTAESMVDSHKFKTAKLTDKEIIQIEIAKDNYQKLNIKMDYSPSLELMELRNKLLNLSSSTKIKLIVVDYLQLLTARGYGTGSRQQEVAAISRTLKMIGGEIGCPVIALSQLSRGVETREDKRPMLSDLRESGAIEQDADMILFLYREDYYNKEETPEEKSTSKVMEINIAKNRHGAQGTIKLLFHKSYGRFDNM